jgi:hypothetical protein
LCLLATALPASFNLFHPSMQDNAQEKEEKKKCKIE